MDCALSGFSSCTNSNLQVCMYVYICMGAYVCVFMCYVCDMCLCIYVHV